MKYWVVCSFVIAVNIGTGGSATARTSTPKSRRVLEQATSANIDELLKAMKTAPSEERYYLAQKIFWLRGNLELCSFANGDEAILEKCLRRIQPVGTPPFDSISIGDFGEACAELADATRKTQCVAAAAKATKNMGTFAVTAKSLLPRDGGALKGNGVEPSAPTVNVGDQQVIQLSQDIIRESENFRDRSAGSSTTKVDRPVENSSGTH